MSTIVSFRPCRDPVKLIVPTQHLRFWAGVSFGRVNGASRSPRKGARNPHNAANAIRFTGSEALDSATIQEGHASGIPPRRTIYPTIPPSVSRRTSPSARSISPGSSCSPVSTCCNPPRAAFSNANARTDLPWASASLTSAAPAA